ncbi:MAG: hypothetical protein Q7V20_21785 [Aquabacterium sp.]|uniref:hypothetical protein n=1 Tax=Aquabacterium sp. TaxID=1872578 RepID=UPI0027228641|nr:hypothetical protein [Aquabacterium sp.]MDO9006084.1 hypothetical protein [Aquabacterium sp.]
MRLEDEGLIDGSAVVDRPLVFEGEASGSMTVTADGTLHLRGTCCGSLHVHKGGIAIVHGVVKQDVINEGILELRGRVEGNLFSKGAFYLRITPGVVLGTVEI